MSRYATLPIAALALARSAGGPGLQNARTEGQYDVYVSLKADY